MRMDPGTSLGLGSGGGRLHVLAKSTERAPTLSARSGLVLLRLRIRVRVRVCLHIEGIKTCAK